MSHRISQRYEGNIHKSSFPHLAASQPVSKSWWFSSSWGMFFLLLPTASYCGLLCCSFSQFSLYSPEQIISFKSKPALQFYGGYYILDAEDPCHPPSSLPSCIAEKLLIKTKTTIKTTTFDFSNFFCIHCFWMWFISANHRHMHNIWKKVIIQKTYFCCF